MPFSGGRLASPWWIGAFCVIAISAGILFLIPTVVGAVLALWLLVSIPVGVAVGHCALNRDD